MSHDELDTIDVVDEDDFVEDGSPLSDESDKNTISKMPRRAIRRLIEDVLEERRLKAALKGYEDSLQGNDQLD